MKRIMLIMCAALLCIGCTEVEEKQVIQQEITVEEKPVIQQELAPVGPKHIKGLHRYQTTYPDGHVDFLYQDGDNFVTGCVTPDGEVYNIHIWDRSYPQYIYQHWINESPALANSFRDNYNAMISCFDNDADQCDIHVAL